jgi:hypothetical protein
MILNCDIQKTIVQMILHFQRERNVIMYIIEFKKKSKLESFHLEINLNNISIFKIYVFVMFKMMYLINKMQCN